MRRFPLGTVCCLGLLLAGPVSAAIVPPTTSSALRAANPDMLSGGVFAALEADGAFGSRPPIRALRAGSTDLSKGRPRVVLDARVGVNVRLGDDPGVLPETQSGNAEPHIYRSASEPNLLLATFQEGRFSDAGALDCGYAVSRDGGLTWTRGLIPQLTTASGGPYNRATDPVAAIGPQGDLYLNTLGSISGAFNTAAVLVSRSTDRGASWSPPVAAYQSTNPQISPDKNWMAVNDFPGTPTTGRLVVTWTNFTSNASGASTGNNLLATVSDDRGATWSAPVAITPDRAANQGTQPVFLPDGSLVVVYVTFPSANVVSQFVIECKRSTDGGRTFPSTSTTIVPLVNAWDDPDLRDGIFLPMAAVARQTGDLFVTYTAVIGGNARVLVTKSSNAGASWTPPVVVSDNPAGVSVMNPAVAVSPDGQAVSVAFLDKRNASDGHNFIDTYAALSLDGGATWQPNLRLTDMTSDIRYATLTTRGYMLGDYQGIAPALAADQPCVATWCDARGGDADPFTVRFTPVASESFSAWAIAQGVSPQSPADDTDGDGYLNAVEYRLGSNALNHESGETFVTRQVTPGVYDVAWVERTADTTYPVTTVGNPPASGVVESGTGLTGVPLSADNLPTTPLSGNLHWVGARFTPATGAPLTVGHALKFSTSIPPYVSGERATTGTDARMTNVATRGFVGTAASQMIVGFVVDGQKTMLVRAAGPALSGFGVAGALATPQLSFSATGATSSSTTASAATTAATVAVASRVGAFPLTAGDAALVQTVPAGSYTAVVSGASGATGVALVEAYDADAAPGAPSGKRITNLSTRGSVGEGGNPLIAGFVVQGTQPRRVLVRAVGPSLARFGITGFLADPLLTINGTGGTVAATNDDWEVSRSGPAIAATAQRLGAFALIPESLDAAVLVTLAPGAYTATVSGVNGSTGVALIEVYDAD